MQSSSRLFPVALVSAELRADLTEDIYRLKPGNSPDASVELVVTQLGQQAAGERRGPPVILLHGSFSNRRFWYSPRALGLGPYLARAGFDVWLPEMRGHGLSIRNDGYRDNRVADYARYDLPALASFIHEQCGQPAHWIGHSLGGVVLAAGLGGGYLDQARIASVALFGSQVSTAHWLFRLPMAGILARLLLRRVDALSGSRWRQGPEDEPVGVALEVLRWHGLFGRFGEPGNDWWKGLAAVDVPLLAVAGAGDRQDPSWACRKLFEQFASSEREYLLLGREAGYAEDYGHIEMLIGKAAQLEVWPLVERWLRQRSPAGDESAWSEALDVSEAGISG
ncbi:alpha/beta fold hydrolase [Pseudomonas aeruginosa]|uniref:alpha/beta fold hydrolase n=1 Tax=Pseudomonas aeruginosa TaxID=287 RepID=UPI000F543E04|nr:alpha/beta fold hydrolase [Pseudomonas aeruginosa]RQB84956.1 alpha/beta hydrolase [Pseudomonas aeruginosa]